jgi:hypothetical protein
LTGNGSIAMGAGRLPIVCSGAGTGNDAERRAAGPGRPPLSGAASAESTQASLPEQRCEPLDPTPNF